MQDLLGYFVTKSVAWLLIVTVLVTFLESLALIGLVLPGTVIMIGLGALISNGQVNFWLVCLAGMFGCLLGDWISFWIGRRFKKMICNWSFIKNNKVILNKTEYALSKHSMLSILLGRFVGPTRPLIPMMAGILNLPITKFFLPSILGSVLWPLLYFFPGILAGAAIEIPASKQSREFKWLLLIIVLLLWLVPWLCWHSFRNKKNANHLMNFLPYKYFIYITVLMLWILIIALIIIIHNPVLPIYLNILSKVI